MSYHDTVNDLAADAEQLEQVYHSALEAGEKEAFKEAVDAGHTAVPENLLYAAWFHRLKYSAGQAKGYVVAWAWVIPLAIINGLLFWWLSDDRFMITIEGFRGSSRDFMPVIVLLAAPLSAAFVLIYLTAAGRKRPRLSALIGITIVAAGAYVLLIYPQLGIMPFQEQYLTLMTMHLPLLAWAGVGAFLVARHRDPTNRFTFLIKSLEAFIFGGLFLIAGVLFTAITVGLFEALDVQLPDEVMRLFVAGGVGLVAVVAVAVMYNPTVPPAEQAFDEGLSKLVALLMRIMLPLTLLVLLVYLAFIPFNFRAPFDNRDVLIIYNGMLFAVVVLLDAQGVRRFDVARVRRSPAIRRSGGSPRSSGYRGLLRQGDRHRNPSRDLRRRTCHRRGRRSEHQGQDRRERAARFGVVCALRDRLASGHHT